MTGSRRRHGGLIVVVTYLALAIGSTAGLCWLAPLEYGTGMWLGLNTYLAVAVPCLVDSYVVLSVMATRELRWSLPIVGVSGLIGQLHAAKVLPDTGDAKVAVSCVAIGVAVAVTARLKPLAMSVLADVRRAFDVASVADLDAEDLADDRAHKRALRAIELDAARTASQRPPAGAEPDAHMATHGAVDQPMQRPARKATRQVRRAAPPGLTDSAVTVWSYLLGRPETKREDIKTATGMPDSTLKVAIGQLTDKGHVVSRRRGWYQSVDPDTSPDLEAEPVAISTAAEGPGEGQ